MGWVGRERTSEFCSELKITVATALSLCSLAAVALLTTARNLSKFS